MTANCSRFCGLQSTFAPTSRIRVSRASPGTGVASAGRSTPGIVPMISFAATIAAPEFPAVTNAHASPSRTSRAASAIEEPRLPRTGAVGGSSIATTSAASTISRLFGTPPVCSSWRRSTASRPTRRTRTPNCRTASTAPATVAAGAWSPPIASRATAPETAFVMPRPGSGDLLDVQDLTALVHATVLAHAVRLLRLEAVRAYRLGRLGQVIMRPPLVAARLGMTTLWVGHRNDLPRLLVRPPASQRREPIIVALWGARARPQVEVCAAAPTDSAAVLGAQWFHRHGERELLGRELREVHERLLEEAHFEVVATQPRLVILRRRRHRQEVQLHRLHERELELGQASAAPQPGAPGRPALEQEPPPGSFDPAGEFHRRNRHHVHPARSGWYDRPLVELQRLGVGMGQVDPEQTLPLSGTVQHSNRPPPRQTWMGFAFLPCGPLKTTGAQGFLFTA